MGSRNECTNITAIQEDWINFINADNDVKTEGKLDHRNR